MVLQRRSALLSLLTAGALIAVCVLVFGGSSGVAATKAPIKVGLVGDIASPTQSFRDAVGAVEARTKAINATGGINGRKIQLIKCDAKSDPNVGAACAQKFVSEKVAVVSNPFSVAGGSMQPVWSKAKIPAVGNPFFPVQYTDRYAYILGPGLVGAYFAVGKYLGDKGCRKAGVIASAVGAYQSAATNSKRAFTAKGGQIVSDQSPPPGAPDYTPYLQSVLNAGATCLIYVVPNTDTAKLMTAVKQSSRPNLLVVGTESAYDGVSLGSLGNGLIGTSPIGPKSTYDKAVVGDQRKYAKSTKPVNYYYYGYASMKIIEAALRAVKGPVTSASVVKSLDSLRNIDTAGIFPRFSYRGLPFSNPSYSRVAEMIVYVNELRNGKSTLRRTINLRSTFASLR